MDDWDSSWRIPPASLAIEGDAAHVWRGCLDLAPERIAALRGTLAADERARAERFRFPHDRDRFIAARGLLRAILARYLDREPGAIAFRYGASGKPALRDAAGSGDLRFNVSHAGGVALYAVTRGREIGVDVEAIKADFETERIAERFFSPREIAALRALPPEERPAAFFRCWTRKEAYVKARGAGITTPLDAFDVSLAPDAPAAILAIRGAGAAGAWSLHHLDPGPGMMGAVAVAGAGCRIACWQWQEPPQDCRLVREYRGNAGPTFMPWAANERAPSETVRAGGYRECRGDQTNARRKRAGGGYGDGIT